MHFQPRRERWRKNVLHLSSMHLATTTTDMGSTLVRVSASVPMHDGCWRSKNLHCYANTVLALHVRFCIPKMPCVVRDSFQSFTIQNHCILLRGIITQFNITMRVIWPAIPLLINKWTLLERKWLLRGIRAYIQALKTSRFLVHEYLSIPSSFFSRICVVGLSYLKPAGPFPLCAREGWAVSPSPCRCETHIRDGNKSSRQHICATAQKLFI
jgi:hypothetical protein